MLRRTPLVVLLAASAVARAQTGGEALGVQFRFFGQLVVNANYNTSTTVAGSIPAFVQLRSASTSGQFNISPGNTYLGVDAAPPVIGSVQLSARFDMDFRSNAPYLNENAFLPLVRDLYFQLQWSHLRASFGQLADVISPRSSGSLNFYPLSFLPGDIGDYRPQIRIEWRQPAGDLAELTFQAAAAQAVQTFNVSDTVIATQVGLPDFKGHVGLALGRPVTNGPRFFEVGLSGHVGRRQAAIANGGVRQFTSYSVVMDSALRITSSTLLEGEFFTGQLLGDYSGAINQTIDPVKGVPIRARGGWAQVTQKFGRRWILHAGYGTDDPFDQDLGPAERSSNSEVFGNALVTVVDGFRLGLELSGWRTTWVDRPTAKAFRTELSVIYAF